LTCPYPELVVVWEIEEGNEKLWRRNDTQNQI